MSDEACPGGQYSGRGSRTPASEAPESVTLPRHEFDTLLAVATMYIDAFAPDEMMTLPAKLMLQDVEAIVERYGRRY
jgi:hypothetical protein